MRVTIKTSLILAALFVAAPACGSESNAGDSLVGNWSGECATTKDQDNSKVGDSESVKLQFAQDGTYSQSVSGPDGDEIVGNYTVAGQFITVTSDGDSVKLGYSIEDGVLTTKTQDKSDDVPVTSTCNLRQGSGG